LGKGREGKGDKAGGRERETSPPIEIFGYATDSIWLNGIFFIGNLSQIYEASPAVWD